MSNISIKSKISLHVYIFTFHNSKNYGAFLQTYALHKHVPSIIANYKTSFKIGLNSCAGRLKKYLPFFWRFIALYRYLRIDKSYFKEITVFNKTDKFLYPIKEKVNNKFKNQIALCGSDQIWNPQYMHSHVPIYFASFSNFAKRISYAASLGMKQWPKEFEQRVLPMLQKFDAISVREESAVKYLTSLGLKNVVCVCDPTILHKANFYREQFPTNKNDKDEYAFVYKIRELIPDAVQEIFPNKIITVDLQKRKSLVSVTEWLSYIDNAKFVVTDSFHCAVFCILFHKPFLVIPNQSTGKGMNERFATLLGKTSLEYRCLTCEESTEQVLEKLNSPIDWDHVDAVLEEWRTYSANWLKNALEI